MKLNNCITVFEEKYNVKCFQETLKSTMSVCIHDTILAIADQLGITIRNSTLESYSREAEFRFEQIISPLRILQRKTHCSRLTVEHVNMVLESRRMPPLYGYSHAVNVRTQTVSSDECNLVIAVDPKIDLSEEANRAVEKEYQSKQFGFQWAVVDGVQIAQRTFAIEGSRTPMAEELLLKKRIKIDQKITNESVLNADLIDFYNQIVELFDREGDEESMLILFDNVGSEGGIQDLVPGFLQFLISKLTVGLDDIGVLKKIVTFCLALIENQSVPILFYVHTFLRILMTVILKNVLSCESIDDDIGLRKECAVVLKKLSLRCSGGYRDLNASIINALIRNVFNPYNSLISQLGALNALYEFDKQTLIKNIRNIQSYSLLIRREFYIEKQSQKEIVCKIIEFLQQLFNEILENNLVEKIQELKIKRIQKENTIILNKI